MARAYLKDLTLTLRLHLAKYAQKHLHDSHHVDDFQDARRIYVPAKQWRKFVLWRILCFLPEVREMPVELLHVAFDHYSKEAMQFLCSDKCSDLKFKNASLIFKAGFPSEHYPLPSLSYKMHFKKMLFRFTDLTEVNLGTKCGDSCLQAVGERCTRLRKLTLSSDNNVTNDGFVLFAKSQLGNGCLDGIFLLCSGSQISLLGLSQIWLLPLPIKTLHCYGAHFDHATDEDIPLECPNGPTQLTDLTIEWDIMTASQELNVRKVLDCSEVLFPALQSMIWKDPNQDMVTSGTVWRTVARLNQTFYSAIDLQELADCFPKLVSLRLKNITHFDSLRHGSFNYLTEFMFGRGQSQGYLSFDCFASIASEAQNLRAINVQLSSEVINQYTNAPLCKLFHCCKHLKKLEVFNLFTVFFNREEKIPLTETFISCILQTCQDIQLIGDLGDWAVDLVNIGQDKRFDIVNGHDEKAMAVLATFRC